MVLPMRDLSPLLLDTATTGSSASHNMASSTLTLPSKPDMVRGREYDAAYALLGVSPAVVRGADANVPSSGDSTQVEDVPLAVKAETSSSDSSEAGLDRPLDTLEPIAEDSVLPMITRPRSGSVGLDALAALASREQATMSSEASEKPLAPFLVGGVVAHSYSSSSSSDDDSEAMPPPPPRRRPRSASNPEGMEKWDSLGHQQHNARQHFVLPASILEQELKQASAAVREQERRLPIQDSIPEEPEDDCSDEDVEDEEPEDDQDDADLSPEELLQRARSRLLEDLSEGSMSGEKGTLTMPHLLTKYKNVSAAEHLDDKSVLPRFHVRLTVLCLTGV